MSNFQYHQDVIRAWLKESEVQGRITWNPESRAKFADLYSLYLSTTTGAPLGKPTFATMLEVHGVPAVRGTGNVSYRRNIHINPAS